MQADDNGSKSATDTSSRFHFDIELEKQAEDMLSQQNSPARDDSSGLTQQESTMRVEPLAFHELEVSYCD